MLFYCYMVINSVLTGNISLLSNAAAVSFLALASIIDIRERRIPDRLVMAGASTGLVFSLFNQDRGLADSLMGGITSSFVLLLVYCASKGALGLGDVKLFGCLGIYLGLGGIVSAMLAAAVLSGLYSLVLVLLNRDNRKREIPFAPFILLGALAAII